MNGPYPPLYDLLLSLFDNRTEVLRFLALSGFADVEHRLSSRAKAPFPELLSALTDVLMSSGMQEKFLQALLVRSPDRADDVRRVLAGLTDADPGRLPVAGVTPVVSTGDDEVDALLAQLDAELATDLPVDRVDQVLAAPRWAWTAATAVLGRFRPAVLKAAAVTGAAMPPEGSAAQALSGVSSVTHDGWWVLDPLPRRRALERLAKAGELRLALQANADQDDPARDTLDLLVAGTPLQPSLMSTEQLDVVDTVLGWVDPLGLPGVEDTRAAVYAALERRRLIDPLRRLVGQHFRGRVAEWEELRTHAYGYVPGPARMVVSGPGGSGKSSLIGRLLLELEQRSAMAPVPFAYLDFDKTSIDPYHARGLVEEVARQLRLLYANAAEVSRGFAALESVSADIDVEYALGVLDLSEAPAGLDAEGLLRELAFRLTSVVRPTSAVPLVLVLDTLEEVQLKGPGPTQVVLDLLANVLAALPAARVVLAGRGDLEVFTTAGPTTSVVLGDLDPAAADAVLEALGVSSERLRELAVDQFGRNPLTLRLAAEALSHVDDDEPYEDRALVDAGVLAAAARDQIQGMLYGRILGHIKDPSIARIAHPGLVVRRIDVAVVRDVLAAPCKIDPGTAADVFVRLRRQITLFDLEPDGTLRHRADVRRLMLRMIMHDPKRTAEVAEIHQRAVDHYSAIGSIEARAEELYHRLMRGDPPVVLTHRWLPSVEHRLGSALDEPLPPTSRSWLEQRLGLADPRGGALGQAEWEVDAAARATSYLLTGAELPALEILRERPERLPGSPLYALETEALIRAGRLDEASDVIEVGLPSAIGAHAREAELRLSELALELDLARSRTGAALVAARSAVTLADSLGEPARALSALCRLLEHIDRSDDASIDLLDELGRRFRAMPTADLISDPTLTRRVLHVAGHALSDVIVKAALDFDAPNTPAVFRDDAFALEQLLDQASAGGQPQLGELAESIGLPTSGWSNFELARGLTAHGQLGHGVAVGMDLAEDEAAARELVVGRLLYPVEGPREA